VPAPGALARRPGALCNYQPATLDRHGHSPRHGVRLGTKLLQFLRGSAQRRCQLRQPASTPPPGDRISPSRALAATTGRGRHRANGGAPRPARVQAGPRSGPAGGRRRSTALGVGARSPRAAQGRDHDRGVATMAARPLLAFVSGRSPSGPMRMPAEVDDTRLGAPRATGVNAGARPGAAIRGTVVAVRPSQAPSALPSASWAVFRVGVSWSACEMHRRTHGARCRCHR
jgi:hypothetical protein